MHRRDRFAALFLTQISPFVGVLLGAFTVLWGIWLCMPWDVFENGPQYRLIDSLAAEPVWGVAAIIIGFLLTTASWSIKPENIKYAALAGFYFWLMISVSYMYSSIFALAWIPAMLIAFMQGYGYINIKMRMGGAMGDDSL